MGLQAAAPPRLAMKDSVMDSGMSGGVFPRAGENGRISVALCSFNGARFLEQQLDSIASQTRPPDELVICDDLSTDGSRAVIEEFAGKAPFYVKVEINRSRLGATGNFARAIGLCRGEIIALSDQDDYWYPEKLEKIEQGLSGAPGVEAIFSDALVVDEKLEDLGYTLWESERFGEKEREIFRMGEAFILLMRRNVVAGTTLAFRGTLKDTVLPIPDGWVHDIWIAFIASTMGRLEFIPEPLVKYRQHGRNLIGTKMKGLREQAGGAKSRGKEFFIEEASRWGEAAERVLARTSTPRSMYIVSLIEEKIDHMRAREKCHSSRGGRLRTALGELRGGRYHKYSNGMKSFLRDLFPGRR